MRSSRSPLRDAAAPTPSGRPAEPLDEDHRSRVGRERRERMRGHLLQSILHVCSAEGRRSVATIDDVIRHADVSRGTFYKHFASMDQATSELGLLLADEMTLSIASVYDVLEEPIQRTAAGFQLFLIRAMLEPEWGVFIAKISLLSTSNFMTRKIRDDIALGVETGDYRVPSVTVASDLLMGAKIEAIRRLSEDRSPAYAQAMTSMVLRSFGVSPAKAERSVAAVYAHLCAAAPGRIAWWRSIE